MIPDVATKKLAVLAQAASDAMALAQSAKRQTGDAEHRLQLLINARASEADLAKAAEEVERAQDLQQVRYRAWQTAEGLVTKLWSWLNELPDAGARLEAAPVPLINLNGAPAHLVGTLRAEIAKLAAEHHAIKVAPAPLDDAKRQVRELVARLGTKGNPKLTTQFGTLHIHGWESAEQFGPTWHDITVATLCWLMPDMVIARLDEAIEALPQNGSALPVAERASKLAEIEAEIALLEDREEAMIMHAAAQGVTVERRYDQSPASILGVRIATAAARVAA
jgi:hypothetical protein